MDFEKQKKQYTFLIVIVFIAISVLTTAGAYSGLFKFLKDFKPNEHEREFINYVEPVDVEGEYTEEFSATFTDESSVFDFEVSDGVSVVEDPVIANEEEEGYDYSTDSTDSFDTSYLQQEDEVPTVVLEDLPYSMQVTWKTLASTETYEAIYGNIKKDESFDADKQTRCLNRIAEVMKQAQEFMSSAEGTTTTLEYGFYTSAQELMIELRVLDESGSVCYSEYFGLGILSNEGDVE